MNRTLLIFGVVSGLLGFSLFLGPAIVNPDSYMDPDSFKNGEVIGYTVMFLSMIPVYFGTRAYRNKFYSDHFSFGKGLGSGMLITLISCVIFYIGNVLLYEVISPSFLEDFGKVYHEYMLESAKTQKEIDNINAQFGPENSLMFNSYFYGLIMTSSVFFFGLVISLISALVLKRNVD